MKDSESRFSPMSTLFPTSMDALADDHEDLEQPRSRQSAALAVPIAYAVCVAAVAVIGAALVMGDSPSRVGRATSRAPAAVVHAAAAPQVPVASDATVAEALAPRDDATMVFLDGATISMPAPIGSSAAGVGSAEVDAGPPPPPLAGSSQLSKR